MKPLARAIAAALSCGALAGAPVSGEQGNHQASRRQSPVHRDALADGFANPPVEARPLVFWQWVNGNVTEEGIHLDLEWMKRIGLAGAILFDVGFRTPPVPQYVAQRVGFGTEEWRKALRFAGSEAKRLGLSLGAQSSGGWSVSGGPSVTPDHAMKKLVWSETEVTADSPAPLVLAPPPRVSGPYQDVPIDAAYREPERAGDVAVIAFRLPDSERSPGAPPVLTKIANAGLLEDGRYAEAVEIPGDERGDAWLQAEVKTPPRALTLAARRGVLPPFVIESGVDGVQYLPVDVSTTVVAQAAPVTTVALAESGARFWRIRFDGLTTALALTEARFDFGARLDHAQEKAGFGTLANEAAASTGWNTSAIGIDQHSVIDLTSRMAPDGRLDWRPKNGRWMVQRFGWSLTGRRTVPATAESIGLEVDKLDAGAVRAFAESFYDNHARAMGDAGHLDLAFTDSWEAGQQSWTPALFEEFRARRGYDLRPWLPVLTGRVVGDGARSERVLADFRRTISDLLVANHYAVLADVAQRRGMRYVAQAAGTDVPVSIDGIAAKGRADVPTGEFWFYPEGSEPKPQHVADVREAASAAHLYGKSQVAAESLTSQGELPWAQGPAEWRRMVDRFFAEGMNRVILHTSAHQPFSDRVPGITLRQYGQHFTRNETWAGDAGAWVSYLSRTSWMLQQGTPVADLAIYIGGGPTPLQPIESAVDRQLAAGFDHDFLNTESLMKLDVRDGRLVLPGGASYRMLVVDGRFALDLPALRKLLALMDAGATVVAAQPQGPRTLADDATKFREIAGVVWGRGKVQIASARRGRGYLFGTLKQAFERHEPAPDVAIAAANDLHWSHRRTADADIYFVTNQSGAAFEGAVKFRVAGRHVELWDAVDGARRAVAYEPRGQTTSVQVELPAHRSLFVVFRGPSTPGARRLPAESSATLATLDGAWDVSFPDGRGAPRITRLSGSWTDQADAGIRYYSGLANYSRRVTLPAAWLANGRRIELDLGAVGDLAHVSINGHDLGTWWSPPLRQDITDVLHAGDNQLEITVTNYWANRLIGDEQPGAMKHTFAPIKPYTADSPLRPAGLIGPVRLIGITTRESP